MFEGKRKLIGLGAIAVVGAAAIAGGAAVATGQMGDSSQPITGPAYDKAVAAALAETGGGRVTETEEGDEESYYQVEVTLDNGDQVDVNLDENFNVVKTKAEHGETNDDSGANDD